MAGNALAISAQSIARSSPGSGGEGSGGRIDRRPIAEVARITARITGTVYFYRMRGWRAAGLAALQAHRRFGHRHRSAPKASLQAERRSHDRRARTAVPYFAEPVKFVSSTHDQAPGTGNRSREPATRGFPG